MEGKGIIYLVFDRMVLFVFWIQEPSAKQNLLSQRSSTISVH